MSVEPVEAIVFYLAFVFSATVHEAAHARAAKRGGDPTAYLGGHAPTRKVTLGSGTIEVRAPCVDDRRESDEPPYLRCSPEVTEVAEWCWRCCWWRLSLHESR